MFIGLHVEYPLFLSDFKKLEIFWKFFYCKITELPNFMKIHPVGADLFHEGGGKDGHVEANSRF